MYKLQLMTTIKEIKNTKKNFNKCNKNSMKF